MTIRHFSDQNVLKTHKQNGPLKPVSKKLLISTAKKIIKELKKTKKTKVCFLFTTNAIRISETVNLLSKILQQNNINIEFQHDVRLEVMDQGDLILPDDYKNGDWFTPLDVAWDAICDEAYLNDNIFYQFGDNLDNKYPILSKSFSRCGESFGWSLINKYSLVYDLIHGKLSKEDELLVVVGQSDLPLIIMELQMLEERNDVTPENLPCKCWEIYKSGLQEDMYDKNAKGDGNFDIPMGYVGKFDLSSFIQKGFDKVIKKAELVLLKKKNCMK